MGIDALFLDLDGTLLDGSDHKYSISRTCEALATRIAGLDSTDLVDANGRIFRKYGPELIDAWTLGQLSGQSLGLEVWRRTLEACGESDPSVVDFAVRTHLRYARQTYRLYADARELIAEIKQARIPLALITNGASDTQRGKLDALGILDDFDTLVISGEIGVRKPDPRVFAPAMRCLGVAGKTVWHIGDNPATDVAGAQAAGLTGVWLNRSGGPNSSGFQPNLEIQSLVTLTRLLQQDGA